MEEAAGVTEAVARGRAASGRGGLNIHEVARATEELVSGAVVGDHGVTGSSGRQGVIAGSLNIRVLKTTSRKSNRRGCQGGAVAGSDGRQGVVMGTRGQNITVTLNEQRNEVVFNEQSNEVALSKPSNAWKI